MWAGGSARSRSRGGTTSLAYAPTTGQLTTLMAPDGGTLAYTYDGALVTSETWGGPAGAVSGNVSRTYDSDFRVASEKVNGANAITFGYDPDSLLIQAGDLSLGRDAQTGFLTGTTLGSLIDTRSYSTFGELTSYQATFEAAALLDVQYTRDALGRITQKTETIGGVTDTVAYTYDLAGRLAEARKNGTVVASYGYDSNSNRLSRATPTGTITGTYDAQDRLLTYGEATYSYTANGELQSKTTPAGTTTYRYDVLGDLLAATLPDGASIEYLIDGRNRRIGKKVNGVLVQGFLFRDQLKPVAELDGSGAVVARFVYGSSLLVPDYLIKGGVTYRIVSDHLGSPRLVVDTTTGAIVQRLDYDEFGNITLDTNPGFQPFGFAGGLYDRDTKLTRFGVRDYDAETGRWTAKDPIGFRGAQPNLYVYAQSNPQHFVDPTGLQGLVRSPADAAAAATIGTAAIATSLVVGAGANAIYTGATAALAHATGFAFALELTHGAAALSSAVLAGGIAAPGQSLEAAAGIHSRAVTDTYAYGCELAGTLLEVRRSGVPRPLLTSRGLRCSPRRTIQTDGPGAPLREGSEKGKR